MGHHNYLYNLYIFRARILPTLNYILHIDNLYVRSPSALLNKSTYT